MTAEALCARALPILDEASRRLGDQVDLRLAYARYWAERGGPQGAAPASHPGRRAIPPRCG